jgi:hypothetical protein
MATAVTDADAAKVHRRTVEPASCRQSSPRSGRFGTKRPWVQIPPPRPSIAAGQGPFLGSLILFCQDHPSGSVQRTRTVQPGGASCDPLADRPVKPMGHRRVVDNALGPTPTRQQAERRPEPASEGGASQAPPPDPGGGHTRAMAARRGCRCASVRAGAPRCGGSDIFSSHVIYSGCCPWVFAGRQTGRPAARPAMGTAGDRQGAAASNHPGIWRRGSAACGSSS